MNIETIWNFELKRGNGHNPADGACLMDAVSWFEYGTLGDHPQCVCPVIAVFCRNANDAMTDAGRQKLKAFIPRLIGTRDPENEKARAEYLVWKAIRVFTPFWLDKAGMHGDAVALRNFQGTIKDAYNLLKAIEKRAATSYAASAAYAASAYAAYASAATSYAASASYAAYAAYASSTAYEWEPLLINALDGVLKIGKHGEAIEAARIIAVNDAFAKAREVAL